MCLSIYSKRRILFCSVLVVFQLIVFTIIVRKNSTLTPSIDALSSSSVDVSSAAYIVSTSGCRIPYIDPFDDLIKPIIKQIDISEVTKRCNHGNDGDLPPSPLTHFISSENKIVVDEEVLTGFYGVENRADFKCTATAIINNVDVNGVKLDTYRYADYDRDFNGTVLDHVVEDHIRVQCHHKGKLIHRDFYSTIQQHPEIEERCEERFRKVQKPGQDQLSVLILSLDGVSRVNVHRHMSRTLSFLRDKMAAIEMFGYNKLGDNTFPIVMSMLTGLTVPQAKTRCFSRYNRLSICPFVWNEFSRRGYRTAYGEDSFIIDAFHTSGDLVGFRTQPTDYYPRPTYWAEHESVPRILWNQDDYYCFANRLQFPVLIDYARDFITKLKGKPYFGYFHSSSLTHDDMDWAQLADPFLVDFLEQCHRNSLLNNTVLMFMSDHGTRFGPIRETYIGKLEESLPVLFFAFPEWFAQKYSDVLDVLRINSRRLVSSFDVHETLKDIAFARYGSVSSSSADRTSLFREVPESRTCSDANIPENYCTCQSVERASNISDESLIAARSLVSEVNRLTDANRNVCSEFTLHTVARVHVLKPVEAFSNDPSKVFMDYLVMVVVEPGLAQFDALVRFQNGTVIGVLGEVSRINRYGSTAHCVKDKELQKYCRCVAQLL